MHGPKLKHARLCRFLLFVIVLGCGFLPALLVLQLPVHGIVKVIVVLGSLIGTLVFLIRNYAFMMTTDIILAAISCYRTARTQYALPAGRTAASIRRSILRYGIPCTPSPIQPQPAMLRYKFQSPFSSFSRGTEQVIAAYETDLLDKTTYQRILSSAKTNSNGLIGRKKAILLDRHQKKQPLQRVTVALILAREVDPQLIPNLYDLVCKQGGSEINDCMIPCVVDLSRRTCVFSCMRIPIIGNTIPVKNIGIRTVRNTVFGGSLNLRKNTDYLVPIRIVDPEQSLWAFLKDTYNQLVGIDKENQRRFSALSDGEISSDGAFLYVKWDQRGVCQPMALDPVKKIASVEPITMWSYPKNQPVGKKTIQQIQAHITAYFARQGYGVAFTSISPENDAAE